MDGLLGLPSLPKGQDIDDKTGPCEPFDSRTKAELAWTFVSASFPAFAAAAIGPEVGVLWGKYLNRFSPSLPRAHEDLSSSVLLTRGFASHHRSEEALDALTDKVLDRVDDGSIKVEVGTPKTVKLDDAIGAGTAKSLLGKGGAAEMNFDGVATTVAGNLAGGVGEGGGPGGGGAKDPDTRDALGEVDLTASTTDDGNESIRVSPRIRLHVHDTIDFCPGNIGDDSLTGLAGRAETIPMSKLEATERRFGTVYAADVPFDIEYAMPTRAKQRNRKAVPVPPVTPVTPVDPVVLPNHVLFEFGSDRIKPEGVAELRALLPQAQNATRVVVAGHTDSVGSAEFNQGLSERRARAVVKELTKLDPTLKGKLVPVGFGENVPTASNDTAEGRRQNRRVELSFEG